MIRPFGEAVAEGIGIVDPDERFIYVNRGFTRITRYSRHEMLKMRVWDLIDRRASEIVRKQAKLRKAGEASRYEIEMRRKDCSKVTAWVSAAPILDDGGRFAGTLAIVMDVTKTKKAERELAAANELLESLLRAIPDIVYFRDKGGRYSYVNPAFEKETGKTLKEVLGKTPRQILPPDLSQTVFKSDRQVLEGDGVAVSEDQVATWPDGRRKYYRADKVPVLDARGKVVGLVGISHDTTEDKSMEESLRASGAQARSLIEFQNRVIDTAAVWVTVLDGDGNITLWNHAAELISGYSKEEVQGHNKVWKWLYPDPDYRARVSDRMRDAVMGGRGAKEFETTIKCKDGSSKMIAWFDSVISDDKGNRVGGIAIGLDVTERESLEKELEALAKYPSENPNPIMRASNDGLVLHANPASGPFLKSWDSGVGLALPSLLRVPVIGASASGEQKNVEVDQDGRVFLFTIVPVPGESYVNLYGRDITTIKEAEKRMEHRAEELERLVAKRTERLVEVERFAAIGEVASAVGHDLRSPLQVMTSVLYVIKEKLASLPPAYKEAIDEPHMSQSIDIMHDSVKYMGTIISDLQGFISRVTPRLSEVDVAELVDRTLKGMELPPDIKVHVDTQRVPVSTRVMADEAMMMRVFTNLITNAVQAMPKGGSLTVAASQEKEKDWISVDISDTGEGISQENMRKLFTPLFTTKDRGTGLGLVI